MVPGPPKEGSYKKVTGKAVTGVRSPSRSARRSPDKNQPTTALAVTTDEDFEWTEERLRALDLMIAGIPKAAIAREVGVHRNTINNWCSTPAFLARGQQLMREHVATTRQRRIMETGSLQNKIVKLTQKAVEKLDDDKATRADLMRARELLFEFRALRAEERNDFGDNIRRIETHGTLTLGGEVAVTHTTRDVSYRDFLQSKLDDGIIDAELVDGDTVGDLATNVLQQVLIEDDILDQIEDEDREAAAAKNAR